MAKKDKTPSPAKQRVDAQEKLTTYKKYFELAQNARTKIDWEWFVRKQFVQGNQFLKWNKKTRQVEVPPTPENEVKVIVNKIYATLRAVRGFVTKFQPKWEVMAEDVSDDGLESAGKKADLLDYIYITQGLKKKIKELVYNGLIYSVGFWEIGWDQADDEGEGECFIRSIDPFDLYIDPAATDLDNASFIIKTSRQTIQDIKSNPNYSNTKDLIGDSKLAASELKSRLIQNTFTDVSNLEDELDTKIVKEIYIRKPQEDGTNKIEKSVFVDEQLLMPTQVTLMETYPFVRYSSDVEPLEMYGHGWVKHLIPIQRVINKLEGQILGYNDIFAKGKYVVDKDSGVRVINNRHGQIIERKRGTSVEPIPLQGLPATVRQQVEAFSLYMEDTGGAHDASLGRIPEGAKAGVAIEALQSGDANNLNDLRDNLEDTLKEAANKIFWNYATYRQTTKMIRADVDEGEPNFFNIIGSEADNKPKSKNGIKVYAISKDNDVRVYMGSWLAYSKEAELEKLLALAEAGIIDRQTLLKYYNFPNVQDIVDRVREEKALEAPPGEAPAQEAPQQGNGEQQTGVPPEVTEGPSLEEGAGEIPQEIIDQEIAKGASF